MIVELATLACDISPDLSAQLRMAVAGLAAVVRLVVTPAARVAAPAGRRVAEPAGRRLPDCHVSLWRHRRVPPLPRLPPLPIEAAAAAAAAGGLPEGVGDSSVLSVQTGTRRWMGFSHTTCAFTAACRGLLVAAAMWTRRVRAAVAAAVRLVAAPTARVAALASLRETTLARWRVAVLARRLLGTTEGEGRSRPRKTQRGARPTVADRAMLRRVANWLRGGGTRGRGHACSGLSGARLHGGGHSAAPCGCV